MSTDAYHDVSSTVLFVKLSNIIPLSESPDRFVLFVKLVQWLLQDELIYDEGDVEIETQQNGDGGKPAVRPKPPVAIKPAQNGAINGKPQFMTKPNITAEVGMSLKERMAMMGVTKEVWMHSTSYMLICLIHIS